MEYIETCKWLLYTSLALSTSGLAEHFVIKIWKFIVEYVTSDLVPVNVTLVTTNLAASV